MTSIKKESHVDLAYRSIFSYLQWQWVRWRSAIVVFVFCLETNSVLIVMFILVFVFSLSGTSTGSSRY